jgi:hypothetical protein
MAAVALFCVGAILTLLSAAALWRAVKLPLVGRRVTGELIDWKRTFHEKYLRSGHHITSRQYYPVVRFETPDGARHVVVGSLGYDARPDWPAGHPITVLYAAGNPRDAAIDPLSPTWVFSAVFLVAGLVILAAAIRI